MESSMRRFAATGIKARPLLADGAAKRRQPRPKRPPEGVAAARPELALPSIPAVRDLERRLHEVEQQLQTRTRELSETQQIAKLGSFRWDVKTQVFIWSEELLKLGNRDAASFGHSLEESLKSIHEEDREKVANSLTATVAGEGKPGVEFRILLPDGSIRHWWGTSRREVGEDGDCVALIGICQDITELKAAEHKLRESEENLRHTIELSPHIPWMAAPDGSIIDIGPRLFETTGARAEDALGSNWLEMLHPDDVAPTMAVWMHSIESGESVETEYRLRAADGSYRWCRATAGNRRDGQGDIIRWYGTVEDIHDRKLAETALREAECLNRGILDISPDSIVLLDEEAKIIFLNPTAAENLGGPADQAAGKPWIKMLAPRLRPAARRALAQAREGRSVQFTGSEDRMDAAAPWWDIRVTPILSESPGRFLVVSRDVTDSKIAEERLRWLANHDSLTNLPNRLLLQQKLEEYLRDAEDTGSSVALLLFDLDDFKRTNDTLGHDAGDALLCAFASRLHKATRPDDFVARLGGDEFALLLNGVDSAQQVEIAFERITRSLREPCVYGGGILECNASVGVSFFPEHGSSRSELLKNADIALYAAKADGGSTIKLFEPGMQADVESRLSMLSLAKEALWNDWVEPFYQPKYRLETGELEGFEALLRWRHPEHGVQGPDTIAAAFQDLDLAAQISDRMIDRVIADMRDWQLRGIEFGHIAVNAAAAEFRRGSFAEILLAKLKAAGIPTGSFQLEVTETVFLGRGAEYVETALRTLSRAGVRIALDDFGTGFASLSHLKRFPVDIIKIDRSFVRDLHQEPDNAAIINAVIQLSRSLGISVVAEGIETPEQHDFLLAAGCGIGQGFLYSEAVPRERVPLLGISRALSSGAR
jgi:diguanylate cyclase (GGDEF)-like protein/PAS domain S-box-containing protein